MVLKIVQLKLNKNIVFIASILQTERYYGNEHFYRVNACIVEYENK